jgi:hypothetical protein
MDTNAKTCPDCARSMNAIRILDNTAKNAGFPVHTDLSYAVSEAKRSIWTGLFPVEGTVAAYMCGGCGRILLYGESREAKGT